MKKRMASDNNYCEPEGPIIDLMKKLATSNIKETTILKNSKLIEILQKEFHIETTELHAFEVDLYISVFKKYLKTWPGWDHFDHNIIKIKTTKDKEEISKILKKEYVKFKEYFQNLLNLAQELAADKVIELKEKENSEKEQIVMEVEATRQQLNNLFYQSPIQKNIFNISNVKNPSLSITRHTLKSIINLYGLETLIKLKVDDKYITYEHRNPHKLKHTLVNKKLGLNTHKNISLDQNTFVKLGENSTKIPKTEILRYFEGLNLDNTNFNAVFYSIIEDDLKKMPNILDIPCSYRRYVSKYSYVRYLYCNVSKENKTEKYDLQLEEVISPICEFSLSISDLPVSCTFENSIEIICTECHLTFRGYEILKHFKEKHHEDVDWICMNCTKVCSVQSLLTYGWYHKCK